MIGIVFSNPRHHAEIFVPIARTLVEQGRRVKLVSLAELRGFTTPELDLSGVEVIRAMPPIRRSAAAGSGAGGAGGRLREALRGIIWLALGARLLWLLRDCECVIVPNDAAYPYRELVRALRQRRVPFVLMQEGIRFSLPVERDHVAYGHGGADALCVWGEGSAEYFCSIGVRASSIHVTGNPRFDDIAPEQWRDRGELVLKQLGLTTAPLLYLSNPVDDQGFCSLREKLELFEQFCAEAQAELTRRGIPVVVKLHPREDVNAYRIIANKAPVQAIVIERASLFELLAVAAGAVVLSSTAGLEALAFGVPLGVLALPRYGFAFDYVSSGAAVGLQLGEIGAGIAALFDGASARAEAADALVARHLFADRRAADRVADVVAELVRS